MRRLIRNWLLGYDPDGPATGAREVHHPPHVEGASVFINRISNGFLINIEGRCVYCKDAEDISGIVVATFTTSVLSGKQLDLFRDNAPIGGYTIPSRPFNQSY
jgi:hypothetical protein